MSRVLLFFLIILFEGYVVLSSELIAIRQTMPFVGSGAETVAIIISAVLLPLAVGYHRGGEAVAREGGMLSIRKRLIRNITIAAMFLTIGLSYLLIEQYFAWMNQWGVTNRIMQVSLYSAVFLITPIYLLGQTVPLLANYFRKSDMAETAGKILFISTTGSFLGAIISTLVFMPWLGVGYTITANMLILLVLALLLKPKARYGGMMALLVVVCVVAIGLNNHHALEAAGIIRDNEYSTIRIHENDAQTMRILEINRTGASKYADNENFLFPYIFYLEKNFLTHLSQSEEKKEILVIGAGGFVLGLDDGHNHYTFVDIDDDLQEISETYLLKQELAANKEFAAEPARGFLARDGEKHYDLIVLDVYTNVHSVPPQLMTVEFLQTLKGKLASDGVLAANIATTANFSERFSVLFDNTFRAVFPHYTRQVVQDYNPWNPSSRDYQNVLYIYYQREYADGIYTDNRNTLAYDRALEAEEREVGEGRE